MCKYGLRCPVREANPYRRMAKALKTDTTYLSTLDMRAQKLNGYLVSDKAYDMIYKSIKESMLVVSIDVERMNFIDDLDIINVDDMEWKPYIKEIAGKVAG